MTIINEALLETVLDICGQDYEKNGTHWKAQKLLSQLIHDKNWSLNDDKRRTALQVILCLEYVLGTSRFSPSTAQSMSPNYIKAWILSYVPARFDRMSADDITGTFRGRRIMRRLAAPGNIAGTSPGCSYVMSTCDVLAVFTLFIPRPLETNLLILLGL